MVTTSTTEAELLTILHTSKEIMWWNRLFINIGLDIKHTNTVNCDNKQMVNLLSKVEPIFSTKLHYVNIY
jgi:hypothetical protein